MTTPTVYRPRNPPEEDNPPGWASDDSTELRNFPPEPNPLGAHTERFIIKAPDHLGATQTLYFWAPATRGQDVKEWIYQETGLPTSLFHLVLAINGLKVKNTDFIDALPIKDWQTIVVVLKVA
eukprot:NODE_3146_length_824_cov_2.778934.p2 GENE.NODE_3146_length_824_cov_2.778934~~NODE_3146_length_824_cov_2.778934.p2  ORF type:complete len:123 (+),score=20.97 NODE_3146_length_824_cov_2.778934:356-724(+)